MMLSDVCLSVAYIGPKSRTEWPMKTKFGTKVKVIRPLYSPPCWRVRQLQRWACMGTCWPWETAATLPSARPREALRRPRERRGARHVVAAARLQLVNSLMRHLMGQHLLCIVLNWMYLPDVAALNIIW